MLATGPSSRNKSWRREQLGLYNLRSAQSVKAQLIRSLEKWCWINGAAFGQRRLFLLYEIYDPGRHWWSGSCRAVPASPHAS